MRTLRDLLREEDYESIWNTYLGFLDLTIEEFMAIQNRLLLEQIELLNQSKLGLRLFGGRPVRSIEEFRKRVPLTTYDDYAETLLSQKTDELPSVPLHWVQTTWKGGSNPIKLAPYSKSMVEENTKMFMASLLLSTSKERGHFQLRNNDKFFYGMAPRPYLTGYAPYILKHEVDFTYLPDVDQAEQLDFKERNILGFKMAIQGGADLFYGVSSVLVKIGESFASGQSRQSGFVMPSNPTQAWRLLRAWWKTRVRHETLLPKDLFQFKGIVCGGTDSDTYKSQIEHLFGITPLEIFGGTESAGVAMETWSRNGLTFFPDVNFLEFIPDTELAKEKNDSSHRVNTVLLNELEEDHVYELVITKLRGGAFVRYRIGDLMRCVGLQNEQDGIRLPQVKYLDRVQNIIDLAGFTRITTQILGDAIKGADVGIEHWTATKETGEERPYIHLFYENPNRQTEDDIHTAINRELKRLDSDYRDVHGMLGYDPLRLTELPIGTFERYAQQGGRRIDRINPHYEDLDRLAQAA